MRPTDPTPELLRLQQAIDDLDDLRVVFAQMDCDGERERAWNYLRSRFGEFGKSEMPRFEVGEA